MRVAIVEDEPLARRRLKRLLGSIPDAECVGEANDATAALSMIPEVRPEVLLLDVEMPGMTGLELLSRLEVRPAIVFVTAYENYAVNAFDAAAADYLVKPVTLPRLAEALQRARRWLRAEEQVDVVLYSRHGSDLRSVMASSVDYFEAQGDYVAAWSGNRSVLLQRSMGDLEAALPSGRFARIHRSVLVNLHAVTSVRPHGGHRLALTLRSGATVVSSRRRTAELRALLR